VPCAIAGAPRTTARFGAKMAAQTVPWEFPLVWEIVVVAVVLHLLAFVRRLAPADGIESTDTRAALIPSRATGSTRWPRNPTRETRRPTATEEAGGTEGLTDAGLRRGNTT